MGTKAGVALANLDVQKEASRLALAVVPRGLSLADLGPRGRALAAVPRGPKLSLADKPSRLSLADCPSRTMSLADKPSRLVMHETLAVVPLTLSPSNAAHGGTGR